METTYSYPCPHCPWTIDNQPTTEHLERALIAHVGAEHPKFLAPVIDLALEGLWRKPSTKFVLDSTLTPTGFYQTTCRGCKAIETTPHEAEVNAWSLNHIRHCPAWIAAVREAGGI
jgi:hypothetical protein